AAQPDAHIAVDQPADIRARRARLDLAAFDARTRLALTAYRAAAAIAPGQRLMLVMNEAAGPPDWADIGLEPPMPDAAATSAVAHGLQSAGWLQPEVAGRVAFTLPSNPASQVEALRRAQRQGGAAFALC